MQIIQRLLIVLWSALVRALRFWARDIAQRKTLTGKALSGCLGILVILCACSALLGAVRGAGEAVGLLPTRTPTLVRTTRASATAMPLVAAAPTAEVSATAAPATQVPVPRTTAAPMASPQQIEGATPAASPRPTEITVP